MKKQIAKITRATLGYEDHGILTCMLHLDYGGSGQGAGGYALDRFDAETKERVGTRYGMEFVIRLMRACGVDEWGKLAGRTVYAVSDEGYNGMVRGIEPLPTEPGEPFMFDSIRQLAEVEA